MCSNCLLFSIVGGLILGSIIIGFTFFVGGVLEKKQDKIRNEMSNAIEDYVNEYKKQKEGVTKQIPHQPKLDTIILNDRQVRVTNVSKKHFY